MTRSAKPADVRFYCDADVLGLAKILAGLRPDVTYPGDPGGIVHRRQRPPCPIQDTATKDRIWIPETARQGWLIITRDSRIQDHRAEIEAVRSSSARMIALAVARRRRGGRRQVWDPLGVAEGKGVDLAHGAVVVGGLRPDHQGVAGVVGRHVHGGEGGSAGLCPSRHLLWSRVRRRSGSVGRLYVGGVECLEEPRPALVP